MTRPRLVADRVLVALAATLLLLLIPGVAHGEDVSIGVGAPGSVAVGDDVEVKAIVTAAGEPVEGAIVSLTYATAFAGKSGRVELDRETTSADGIALLSYTQMAADNGEMRVEYVGPENVTVAPVVFDIEVQPDGEQQHRSEAGVSIPWLNGWVVIGLIMIVWALIVYSAIQLVLVGRGASDREEPSPAIADMAADAGSTWVSMALALATIITAIGMVIVFVRNPLTHANLDAPQGYDRTPVGFVGEEQQFHGPGLEDVSLAESGDPVADGQVTYFQFGCAGCHGLTGQGGIVGPELAGEVGSEGNFAEDIREGQRGMPSYEVLSDDQLSLIHTFLDES